jgi:hypothetical protein
MFRILRGLRAKNSSQTKTPLAFNNPTQRHQTDAGSPAIDLQPNPNFFHEPSSTTGQFPMAEGYMPLASLELRHLLLNYATEILTAVACTAPADLREQSLVASHRRIGVQKPCVRQNPQEKCVLIAKSSALSTFDLASACPALDFGAATSALFSARPRSLTWTT